MTLRTNNERATFTLMGGVAQNSIPLDMAIQEIHGASDPIIGELTRQLGKVTVGSSTSPIWTLKQLRFGDGSNVIMHHTGTDWNFVNDSPTIPGIVFPPFVPPEEPEQPPVPSTPQLPPFPPFPDQPEQNVPAVPVALTPENHIPETPGAQTKQSWSLVAIPPALTFNLATEPSVTTKTFEITGNAGEGFTPIIFMALSGTWPSWFAIGRYVLPGVSHSSKDWIRVPGFDEEYDVIIDMSKIPAGGASEVIMIPAITDSSFGVEYVKNSDGSFVVAVETITVIPGLPIMDLSATGAINLGTHVMNSGDYSTTLVIKNVGAIGSMLNWTAVNSIGSVAPSSGSLAKWQANDWLTTTVTITVSSLLSAGVHNGTVTFTPNYGSPVVIPISITITQMAFNVTCVPTTTTPTVILHDILPYPGGYYDMPFALTASGGCPSGPVQLTYADTSYSLSYIPVYINGTFLAHNGTATVSFPATCYMRIYRNIFSTLPKASPYLTFHPTVGGGSNGSISIPVQIGSD